MKRIEFKIYKNNIIVNLVDNTQRENLNNTNVINTKKLYFSDTYIIQNIELVSSFLNVIILKNNIDTFIVKSGDLTIYILKLINNLNKITNLILDYDYALKYDEFLEILTNDYLKYIDLYTISPYLLERIDTNKDLKINYRNEILFLSNFMIDNNIKTYSDIFYKKDIIINEFSDNDYYDFDMFIKINKYLKVIEFNHFDKTEFSYIFNKIKNIKNIKIIFIENKLNLNDLVPFMTTFKRKNEDIIFENKINFKINYSTEYKEKNIFKQLNLNIVKYSFIFIIIIISLMISINLYNNYQDSNKYNNIENDLEKLLDNIKVVENDENEDIIYIEPNEKDKDKITETTTTTTSIYDLKYEKVFTELKKINEDTVGWLTVNNTNIDYPVVQSSNNDYYLNRDFYKNKNRHGWIFMDYRNNYDDISDNTIIYGHNLANQKMFGTLRYASNPSWYKKTTNQIITFNTLSKNMKWQIISVYKVPKTNDYLIANFSSPEEKLSFLKMITERSIYDFNSSYDEDTKILTLSTCSNGTKERFVVHAKLLDE